MSYTAKALELGADAWFVLDDAWQDASGNGHHATLKNGVTLAAGGPGPGLDAQLVCDGVDDHATIPHHARFDRLDKAGTIFHWAKVHIDGSLKDFEVHWSKGSGNFTYRVNSSTLLTNNVDMQAWFGDAVTFNGAFVRNVWVMFALVFDVAGNHIVYRRRPTDSTFTQIAASTSNTKPVNNPDPFYIGVRGTAGPDTRFFRGGLAGIGGTNAQLSVAQLDALYDSAVSDVAPVATVPRLVLRRVMA